MAAALIASHAALPAGAIPTEDGAAGKDLGPLSPATLPPLTKQFAYCTGRLSAELEFSWLFAELDSDPIASERRTMESLLDAVRPAEAGSRVLHLRIMAKFAHADLLRRAMFSTDPTEAQNARRRAEVEITRCRGLILS